MTCTPPDRRTKYLFWILLGLSSTYFAEVTVGNELFPFFTPFTLLFHVAGMCLCMFIVCSTAYLIMKRRGRSKADRVSRVSPGSGNSRPSGHSPYPPPAYASSR